MGFSKDIKLEILSNLNPEECCQKAFLSALIKSSAEYGISNGNITIFLKTQIAELCDTVKNTLKMFKAVEFSCNKAEESLFRNTRYQISISGEGVRDLLLELNVAYLSEDNYFDFYQGLALNRLEGSCCIKEFVKGAFVSCGSASGVDENNKKSIDYHIEWVFSSKEKADDFLILLEKIQVFGRVVKRKKLFVVYLQKFETISDMLVLFNAQENMLKLNGEYAKRSVMNSVNRQSNCDAANMSKVIDTSLAQLRAIELIKETIGFEKLGEDLVSVCMLRLANVEESLQELAELSGLSKSAINYRLGKIMKMAKEIQEEQN